MRVAVRTGYSSGGSATWARTVKYVLRELGMLAEHHQPADLVISSHRCNVQRGVPNVHVCHGIVEHERPDPGATVNVAVSEEVRDYWGLKHVVRQPIMHSFWEHDGSEVEPLIVRWSNYGGLSWLPSVMPKGFEYQHVHGVTMDDGKAAMQKAALVIATGRAALEAASMGKEVLLLDHRPYAGTQYGGVLSQRWGVAKRTNYSGRGGLEWSPGVVQQDLQDALGFRSAEQLRGQVMGIHDPHQIVRELLELAR